MEALHPTTAGLVRPGDHLLMAAGSDGPEPKLVRVQRIVPSNRPETAGLGFLIFQVGDANTELMLHKGQPVVICGYWAVG